MVDMPRVLGLTPLPAEGQSTLEFVRQNQENYSFKPEILTMLVCKLL